MLTNWYTQNQTTKRSVFAFSNPPKCIANFRKLPIHFNRRFDCYQTPSVIKDIVIYIYYIQIVIEYLQLYTQKYCIWIKKLENIC